MPPPHELIVQPSIVVVVDDDPAVCGSLKFSLEVEGFQVRLFRRCRRVIGSPGLAELQLLCGGSQNAWHKRTGVDQRPARSAVLAPAILITSNPSTAVTERARRAKVPIVEKPLLGNALIDKIHAACRLNNNVRP